MQSSTAALAEVFEVEEIDEETVVSVAHHT
jgi:hypothetical protein